MTEEKINDRCIAVGELQGGKWDKKFNSVKTIYSTDGLSPTLDTCGGGDIQVKILEEKTYRCIQVGTLEGGSYETEIDTSKRFYSVDGIAPTLITGDGNKTKKILSPTQCIKVGDLEGGKWDKIHENCRRVYDPDGLSPTVHTSMGGNTEIKVITDIPVCINSKVDGVQPSVQDRIYDTDAVSPALTTSFPVNYLVGAAMRGRYNENGEIEQNLELNEEEVSNALTTVQKDSLVAYETRVRKLTPLEYWRLMGFTDEDFNKAKSSGMSNSQLYKQAGNSIVVQVLEAIFKQLMIYIDRYGIGEEDER